MRSTTVYLDGRDLERGCEALMRFRLTYDGPLLSSKPPQSEGDKDRRIEHKHDIRRVFHEQLKRLWSESRVLNEIKKQPISMLPILPPNAKDVWEKHPQAHEYCSMPEILGPVYGHHGYQYVPVVWKENSLYCSIRILCLRRDGESAVLAGRDLDNRLKTLIDALVMPSFNQGQPKKNGEPFPPQSGETPFFVLLDDDRQITHLEIEADNSFAVNPKCPEDESYVRVLVTVDIKPHTLTSTNMGFAV